MTKKTTGQIENETIDRMYKCIDKRHKDNMAILEILRQYIETNKDIRFSQALVNLKIVEPYEMFDGISTCRIWADEFYREPSVILKRIGK